MATDNFAYGFSSFPDVPRASLGVGLRTDMGIIVPPQARIIYVRSSARNGDYPEQAQFRVPTLAAALKMCRSGAGDVVIVLPGHSESVTDATMLNNLVDGTRIIGMGDPRQDDAPTVRWTTTAAQWALDNKNVLVAGLRLRLEGANGVVKAINITGAGVKLIGNVIEVASGATNKAAIAVEVGSGATNCTIDGNIMTGTATHNVTDGIKVVGATVPSGLRVTNNEMIFSATAANGLLHITVAALNVVVRGNIMYNTHTSSTACVAVDNVAADGVIAYNACGTMNNGTAASQGIVFAGTATIKCFQNFSADEPRASGVLNPAAVAT